MADSQLRFDRMVELNVTAQLQNVAQTAIVQKVLVEHGLNLYGWVYDVRTGKLKELENHARANECYLARAKGLTAS